MGRVNNFPTLSTLWPVIRNVTTANARWIRGQLLKFLIFNIHLLKTPSKDALPLAEPRLIGRPILMARPLTMSNNCLSLLNWLMRNVRAQTAVFFFLSCQSEVFFGASERNVKKKKKKWTLNYTTRQLWLLMMGCMKRLHYFNSSSATGLIAGKIRVRAPVGFFRPSLEHKNLKSIHWHFFSGLEGRG